MESDEGAPPGPSRLRLRVECLDRDHAVITLAGRFDAVEALEVRGRMADVDVVTARHLVFDLTDVTFLDSAGLAVLVRARQDRERVGGSACLVRPASEAAMRVLRLTAFDQIFTMVDVRARETS